MATALIFLKGKDILCISKSILDIVVIKQTIFQLNSYSSKVITCSLGISTRYIKCYLDNLLMWNIKGERVTKLNVRFYKKEDKNSRLKHTCVTSSELIYSAAWNIIYWLFECEAQEIAQKYIFEPYG